MHRDSTANPNRGRARAMVAGLCVLAATACKNVANDVEQPTPDVAVGGDWDGRLDGVFAEGRLDPAFLARWWELLEDPTLTELIGQAAESNFDIRIAEAQLRRARAERLIAESKGKPTVAASGASTRAGSSSNAGVGGTQNLYGASLDASWELDVFGQQDAENQAADADLQSVEEMRRDVHVSLLAELGLNYVDLRTLQERFELASEQVVLLEEFSRIITAQYNEGLVTKLEVDSAEANLELVRSSLPAFTQQIQQLKNRIAVSVGKTPGELDSEMLSWKPLPLPDVRVALGVPAEVLRRRPDVRMAERRLAAETARVGVAIADLYPKFSLVGTIGLESLSFSSLFESASRAFGLGPRVDWTLFDGGRTRARIEIQNAVQEQALIEYEKAIAGALEDVENSITAFTQERLKHESLVLAAGAAVSAAESADIQYKAGEIEFLNVLDTQRVSLSNRDELAKSRGQLVWNLIRLYKSLGGGWDSENSSSDSE